MLLRAGQRIALIIEERADLTRRENILLLIAAARTVTARRKLLELILPEPENRSRDSDQLSRFADREKAFLRNRRKSSDFFL